MEFHSVDNLSCDTDTLNVSKAYVPDTHLEEEEEGFYGGFVVYSSKY